MGQDMIIDRKRLNAYTGLRRTTPVAPTGESGSRVSRSAAPTRHASTEVEVSEQALLFSRLKEHLRQLPEIREDRVEAVREKLLNGFYVVPTDLIIEKLQGGDRA